MTLKLIIFDMDGVLIDACDWHRDAMNRSLMKVCNYEIPLEDHYKIYNGLPTKVKLKKLMNSGILNEEQSERVYNLKQEKTIEIIEECAVEEQDKIELLQWLREYPVNVACFTNSIRETASLMLRKTGILELLDTLITNQDVSAAKPDPEGYLKALKHFGYKKENAFIVEDSPKGLDAARQSGANVYEVSGYHEVTLENILNKTSYFSTNNF